MKIFTLLHKSTDKGTINLGQWSRMGTVNVRTTSDSILSRICLASLILLMLGGFTTRAWGANVAQTTTTIANKGTSATGNGITFSLTGTHRTEPILNRYAYLKAGEEFTLSWSGVPTGYTINVTQLKIRTYRENKKKTIGKYKTYKNTTYAVFTETETDENDRYLNSSSYFPLGNEGYITVRAEGDVLQYRDMTFTYTIGNNYSIRFNGNGSTSGSMSNLSMAYYVAKNLTANAFNRSYSVTYEEDGGSSVADAVAEYEFAGWATSEDGDVIYLGGASVSNLTTTVNDVYDLYAKWNSASVTLPAAPTKSGYQFAGWDDGENVYAAGDSYTPTADVTLTAKWVSKYTFEITGDNYTINNEAWNKTGAFTFVHADEANMTTTIQNTDVISYDRGENTISALKIGTSKITFTQNTSSSVKNGTIEFTITVDSVANTLAVSGTSFTKYVDQEVTSVRSSQNSDGTISTTSSNYNLAHYDIANNKIVIPNSDAQELPFDNVTITISQAATAKYKAKKHTITLTVQKYDNDLTCSWGENVWSKNVNFDTETGVTFSSDNDAVAPIVVTQSPVSAVATYDGTNHKIVANYREGSVAWTVSQDEDYKYKAATTQTLSVNVGTAYTNCYLVDDAPQREWSSQGNSGTYAFTLDQPGDTLFFDAERIDICFVFCEGNNTDWHIQYSTKMSPGDDDWTKLKDDKGNDVAIECEYKDTYYNGFKYAIPADARAIRFRTANVGSFGKKHIRNVKVGRKKWLTLENEGGSGISEIDMPINTIGGNVTRNTFYIDYSTCASKIKLVSNNSRIKFAANNSTTYEFDVENGTRKAIELTYTSPADAEEIEATITVYTPYEHETLTVNAETKGKLTTTIEYIGALSYSVDHANMNATDLFQVRDENGDLLASPAITLATSDAEKIAIVGGNAADFLCGGSATITASYAGDATYAAASDLGQTITVNKLSDAISWSSVGDDGKIHVLADTDIPTSIASANTDIASYSVASVNPYLTVTEEDGVYTLHAGNVGEVALTATSAGDCTYASASGSKTIAVDPREHAIIWDQDLEGIQTDDRGYIINRRITLNAYAVDNESNPTNVPVSYKITGGGTFATIENGNELVINVANLSGTLSTTITATTTVGTKYAIVSETKTISVVRWGTNTAKSADNKSDIVDGKIVINAPHATFTFSGATAITEFGYATVFGKPEGYKLAQSLDNSGDSKTYNFSWVSTNANCSIQVNKISFWIKAYDSDAFVANKAKVSFDGAKEVSVGTAAMTANDGDFKPFSKAENYTNRNVPVVCWVTGSENFDFYIKNIAIEYTVYTTAPSATGDIEQVDRTINAESDKKTVDVRDLFSYAVAPPSDFEYAYEIVGAPEHAFFLADGYTFWADAVGDYTVRAKVTMDEDHRESDWSDEKTIRVNRVPYVFNNSAADKNWETTTNWRIGGWPIENLPTADDDVIVRGQLSVSEEIPVRSLTIDGGVGGVVEIAPTGGLTIGVGGVRNATRDNFKLKTATTGVNKGQTGYLRVSPECPEDVPMPEVTIEMLRQGYSSGYSESSFGASGYMTWQYIGCPIDYDGVKIKSVVGGWMNSWDETTGTWVNDKSTALFRPFKGFANSQNVSADGALTNYKGRLMPNATRTVALTYTDASDLAGWNLLSNSFAAPIDIVAMFNDNSLDDVEAAVYLFNTGNTSNVDGDAGTYTPITKALAGTTTLGVLYQGVIPSMQGFFVKAKRACDFTFNYEHAVWNATYEDESENTSMRAPKRSVVNNPHAVVVSLEANGQRDKVIIIESEDYSTAFENGYDAHIMPVGNFNIFTVEGEKDYLAIDATNSIIGTRVGVRTGTETAYTMTFTKVISEDDIELLDTETDERIAIYEGLQYTFFAEPNSVVTERFQIVEREAPSITTGVDNVESGVKVHKFIKDNQVYILKNGILYNAVGAIVR